MKDNLLARLVKHPDRDEIVSKLAAGIDAKLLAQELREKYQSVNSSLVLSTKLLNQFKDEYLDYYLQIQQDAIKVANPTSSQELDKEAQSIVSSNSVYRQKLEEYLDQEIDIKKIVKNLVVAIEFRASQVFDAIQANPTNGKMDYVLINYMNSLVNVLEKYDTIINGGSDKIVQQNNINIQILDQHVHVIQRAIYSVLERVSPEVSLEFIDILSEELKKLKPDSGPDRSIDFRLSEAHQLESGIRSQLAVPSEL